MVEPVIKDCACGTDHDEMPMVTVSACCCMWTGDDPECDHKEYWVPAVCLKHKTHIPCRKCEY